MTRKHDNGNGRGGGWSSIKIQNEHWCHEVTDAGLDTSPSTNTLWLLPVRNALIHVCVSPLKYYVSEDLDVKSWNCQGFGYNWILPSTPPQRYLVQKY